MINRRLTTREAAERLGVKRATLYAYVSRGLLHAERTAGGSTFDLREVLQLARSARRPAGDGGEGPARRRRVRAERPDDPLFVTELTTIQGGRLYYRGIDAVALSRSRSFEETALWLWTGRWNDGGSVWEVPDRVAAALGRAMAAVPAAATPVERFMAAVVVAALGDDLRHDRNPAGAPVTGRILLSVLAESLPLTGARRRGTGPLAERVWRGLSPRAPSPAEVTLLDAALVLAADHELAPSTMAVRVAASFRADPYAAVLTGLGPASGSWYSGSTGAPSEVEALLREAAEVGPERAIGYRLRRGAELPYGFGMPLYPQGDPRAVEVLARLGVGPADPAAGAQRSIPHLPVGPPEAREVVQGVVAVAAERGFPPPNFDLGLGALAYCAGMVPGAAQAVFTLGKVAGWLAHAVEEYTQPTRFRSRAAYVGPSPAS